VIIRLRMVDDDPLSTGNGKRRTAEWLSAHGGERGGPDRSRSPREIIARGRRCPGGLATFLAILSWFSYSMADQDVC